MQVQPRPEPQQPNNYSNFEPKKMTEECLRVSLLGQRLLTQNTEKPTADTMKKQFHIVKQASVAQIAKERLLSRTQRIWQRIVNLFCGKGFKTIGEYTERVSLSLFKEAVKKAAIDGNKETLQSLHDEKRYKAAFDKSLSEIIDTCNKEFIKDNLEIFQKAIFSKKNWIDFLENVIAPADNPAEKEKKEEAKEAILDFSGLSENTSFVSEYNAYCNDRYAQKLEHLLVATNTTELTKTILQRVLVELPRKKPAIYIPFLLINACIQNNTIFEIFKEDTPTYDISKYTKFLLTKLPLLKRSEATHIAENFWIGDVVARGRWNIGYNTCFHQYLKNNKM